MKRVEIYSLQSDGTQKVEVVCSLGDGGVVFSGEDTNLIGDLHAGITNFQEGEKILFPKDGEAYLRELKYNYHSPYLAASDVFEG